MKKLILAIILLAIPATAGVNEWVVCGSTAQITSGIRVGQSECLEYSWNNVTLANIAFTVVADSALACFEPDVGSTGTDATALIKRCMPGRPRDANACAKVTDAALGGAGGGASTQTRWVRLGKGEYVVDTVATGGAGVHAVFSIEAE